RSWEHVTCRSSTWMAERRRLTVMAVATSALLVALSVCLLLLTGGFATDGWPAFGDDEDSALRMPDARPVAGPTGSSGLVATSGTTLVGTVPGIAPFRAPAPAAAEILGGPRSPAVTVPVPPLVALLPGLPLPTALLPGLPSPTALLPGLPSPTALLPVSTPTPAFPAPQPVRATLPDRAERSRSQAGRDRGRGREERRAPRERSNVRTVTHTTQEQPTTRVGVRQSGGRQRARASDDRRSQRSEGRTERRGNRVERRPDRVEGPSHRGQGRAGRPEPGPGGAERRPAPPDRMGRREERAEQRAEQRAERGRERADRRDGR
ncbi:MAG: hypothetical protein M3417_16460, partial [Actinomycetota bacterium]|nr:hypothetical protein [Actinomycetota bacterium]